ncbi:MAG TPA: ferritin-like domain-containing protein [Gemmataceae bacterium]|nr:ferritin-like domain-containing protein [Gemmataceae bacterium]
MARGLPLIEHSPPNHRSNTMKTTSLEDLLAEELKDLYSAENQLIKALPKMAKAASNPQLKAGFEGHLEQTRMQAERLEQACDELSVTPKGKKCAAMEGLIEEGQELIDEGLEPNLLDAALIAAAQKIEHYEIASYGTVRTWAEQLGEDAIVKLLQETLDEERETDEKLTELAVSMINDEAEEGEEDDSVEDESEEESEDEESNGSGNKGKRAAARKK